MCLERGRNIIQVQRIAGAAITKDEEAANRNWSSILEIDQERIAVAGSIQSNRRDTGQWSGIDHRTIDQEFNVVPITTNDRTVRRAIFGRSGNGNITIHNDGNIVSTNATLISNACSLCVCPTTVAVCQNGTFRQPGKHAGDDVTAVIGDQDNLITIVDCRTSHVEHQRGFIPNTTQCHSAGYRQHIMVSSRSDTR